MARSWLQHPWPPWVGMEAQVLSVARPKQQSSHGWEGCKTYSWVCKELRHGRMRRGNRVPVLAGMAAPCFPLAFGQQRAQT